MDDMCEEAVAEVGFFQQYLLQIKILTYIHFSPLIWVLVIGWRYNPNTMWLSILHFLTSQLF